MRHILSVLLHPSKNLLFRGCLPSSAPGVCAAAAIHLYTAACSFCSNIFPVHLPCAASWLWGPNKKHQQGFWTSPNMRHQVEYSTPIQVIYQKFLSHMDSTQENAACLFSIPVPCYLDYSVILVLMRHFWKLGWERYYLFVLLNAQVSPLIVTWNISLSKGVFRDWNWDFK